MPRAPVTIAPLMLVAGITIGFAVATLLWQAPLERRAKLIEQSQSQTDRAITIARQTVESLKECAASLQRQAQKGTPL